MTKKKKKKRETPVENRTQKTIKKTLTLKKKRDSH